MPTATSSRSKKPAARKLSADHKAALAAGREQGHAVRRYLEALEANKPRRGRKRPTEAVAERLAAIEAELADAPPLKRVQLIQERMDLQEELAADTARTDLAELEAEFVKVARPYSESKGLSWAAWREAGVPPAVLKAAGITRSR